MKSTSLNCVCKKEIIYFYKPFTMVHTFSVAILSISIIKDSVWHMYLLEYEYMELSMTNSMHTDKYGW